MTQTANNPYQVLGVERTARQDEIKAAYRKLALRYHPDRNPGDAQAEEKFKEVSEAYATLREPAARARFDRYGNAGGRPDYTTVDWQAVFREADIGINWRTGVPKTGNAVFDVLFGAVTGMMRSSGMLPGEDRELEVEVPVEVARMGGSVRVRVPGPSICPTCSGTGREGQAPCGACAARGVRRQGSSVDVSVPPGVHGGTRLRLRRLGGPGNPPGDVLVAVRVRLPQGVDHRNGNLYTDLYLTPLEATRGVTARVLGVPVTVPPGSEEGSTIRIAGAGLGGELVVTVRKDLWRGLRRLGEEWLKQLSGAALPLAAKE